MRKSLALNPPLSIFHLFNLKIFCLLGAFSFLSLSIFCVFQINYLAQEISQVRVYERKLGQLTEDNEGLEIDLAKSGSLKNIESFLEGQNFEKINPSQVRYIRILESSVVKKGNR